nr:hypothetical protein [Tanacetum cinerariifolium]
MQNREHGRRILESVENDPLIWPTVEENEVTRINKYVELSATEKIQADCDMKTTSIILQGDVVIACLNKTIAFLTVLASLRNAAWCKEKAMLAEAQEAGQILDEEKLTILADPWVPDGQAGQKDFGKRFTPQQEMTAEQAFWFRISNPTIESSNQPPVKVEVFSELPKGTPIQMMGVPQEEVQTGYFKAAERFRLSEAAIFNS